MVSVVLPALFRALAGGATTVEVSGATLREVLEDVERQHPALRGRVVERGSLRPEVFVAINGVEAFGLDVAIPAGAEVHILPAIAGGAEVPDEVSPFESGTPALERDWRSAVPRQ